MDSAVVRTVLVPGKSERRTAEISVAVPPCCGGRRQAVGNETAGVSISILGVWRTPVYRWKPDIWLTATTPSLFLELVEVPESARLLDCLPSFWVKHLLGKEQAMAAAINLQWDACVMLSNLQILSQFAMAMNRMSFSMMALGLGRSLFPKPEANDLAPAPRAVRAGSYMSAMGLSHPQQIPDVKKIGHYFDVVAAILDFETLITVLWFLKLYQLIKRISEHKNCWVLIENIMLMSNSKAFLIWPTRGSEIGQNGHVGNIFSKSGRHHRIPLKKSSLETTSNIK